MEVLEMMVVKVRCWRERIGGKEGRVGRFKLRHSRLEF